MRAYFEGRHFSVESAENLLDISIPPFGQKPKATLALYRARRTLTKKDEAGFVGKNSAPNDLFCLLADGREPGQRYVPGFKTIWIFELNHIREVAKKYITQDDYKKIFQTGKQKKERIGKMKAQSEFEISFEKNSEIGP